jgi:hypothetical protein
VTENQKSFEIPLGRILDVSPGLPTTDMARTVEHYGRLGFTSSAPGSESVSDACFAIGERDGIALHFALKEDHDPARTATWIYLGVDDADEFAAAGVELARPPHDTDYKMREVAYIDPDGNLLLFGSPLKEAPESVTLASESDNPSTAADFEHEPRAFEFASALRGGDAEQVAAFLADDPSLATAVINSCWPLHLYADAPGHRPNAAAIVIPWSKRVQISTRMPSTPGTMRPLCTGRPATTTSS